jgi:hypothetical protein
MILSRRQTRLDKGRGEGFVRMVAGGDIGRDVAGNSSTGGVRLSEGVLVAIGGSLEDLAPCDKPVTMFMT